MSYLQELKTNTLGLIIFFFLSISAYSQTDFRPGYIITNEQDTIFGEVDYRSDKRMCKVCTFRNADLEISKYQPDEIQAYKFTNSRCFESDTTNGTKFLELLVKGDINIYYYINRYKYYFYLRDESGELQELKYSERTITVNNANEAMSYLLLNEDGSYTRIRRSGNYTIKDQTFKTILHNSLKEVPEVTDDINNLKKPDHKDLINLAVKYNELRDSTGETSVFYNTKRRTDYEFSLAFLKLPYGYIDQDDTYLMYSFKALKQLKNEKLYFQYGIQYAPIKLKYHSYNVFRLPLAFRYQYPGKLLKPHASLGVNFYVISNGEYTDLLKDISPSYDFGIAIRITDKTHLSFDIGGDLLSDEYYNNSDKRSFGQTKSIGLLFDF